MILIRNDNFFLRFISRFDKYMHIFATFFLFYRFFLYNCFFHKYLLKIESSFRKRIQMPTTYINFSSNINDFLQSKYDFIQQTRALCECTPIPNTFHRDSQPNDIVMSMANKNVFNFIIFLKTLRSGKCRASIVLFIDSRAYDTLKPRRFLIEIERYCNLHLFLYTNTIIPNLDLLRDYFFHQFLISRRHLINRVIICDLYDTVFQGDPFSTTINFNSIGFTSEYYLLLNDQYWNTPWLKHVYKFFEKPFEEEKFKNYHPICSGVLFGKVDYLIRFFDFLFNEKIMKNIAKIDFLTDQGLFNYLLIEVLPLHPEIPVTIINWTGPFTTMGTVPNSMISGTEKFGTVKITGSTENAILFHQYNRHKHFFPSLLEKCQGGYFHEVLSFK